MRGRVQLPGPTSPHAALPLSLCPSHRGFSLSMPPPIPSAGRIFPQLPHSWGPVLLQDCLDVTSSETSLTHCLNQWSSLAAGQLPECLGAFNKALVLSHPLCVRIRLGEALLSLPPSSEAGGLPVNSLLVGSIQTPAIEGLRLSGQGWEGWGVGVGWHSQVLEAIPLVPTCHAIPCPCASSRPVIAGYMHVS